MNYDCENNYLISSAPGYYQSDPIRVQNVASVQDTTAL